MANFSILFIYVLLSLTVGCFGISGFLDNALLPLLEWFQPNSKRNSENLEDNIPVLTTDVMRESAMKKAERLIPDLEKLVNQYGYPYEKHEVTTKDGYILSLLRVQHGKNGPDAGGTVRKPVMLQHGITDSAHEYLATPKCLAYFLADKGYDVWVGNSRGNRLSRGHVDKDKDPDKEGTTYWDFSFHEMGVYDLPAVLETIKKVTGQKTHYIGNSMGSTQFLVMGSEVPEALEMTDCVILLTPVVRPTNIDLFGRWHLLYTGLLHSLRFISKNWEIRFLESKPAEAMHRYCAKKKIDEERCEKMIKGFQGLLDKTTFKHILNVYEVTPLTEAANSYLHFWQILIDGKFQKFDFGKKENMIKYKQDRPPEYNLKNINKKLYLVVGGADNLAKMDDIQWLQAQLPSSEIITEKLEYFGHQNFYYGRETEEILYSIILKILTEWESSISEEEKKGGKKKSE